MVINIYYIIKNHIFFSENFDVNIFYNWIKTVKNISKYLKLKLMARRSKDTRKINVITLLLKILNAFIS